MTCEQTTNGIHGKFPIPRFSNFYIISYQAGPLPPQNFSFMALGLGAGAFGSGYR